MGGWRPLLDGADAAAVRAAVDAAAFEDANADEANATLAAGHAGRALLHAYRALDGQGGAADAAADAMDRALGGLVDGTAGPWLYTGFSGVAWVAEHITPVIGEVDGIADIDELVVAIVDRPDWPDRYELMAGLAGLGVYALGRWPRPAAVRIVDRVVDHLDALAEPTGLGITWRTRELIHLFEDERADNADGYDVLGIAHGVAGVVGLLAQICACCDSPPKARALLDGSVPWLLAQARPSGHPRHPRLVGRGLRARDEVDGWCYGDAGTAAVLIAAAGAAGKKAWLQAGLELALHSATVAPDGGGMLELDATLCHGTLGRGHIFNRIGQLTGEARLIEAARACYRMTLEGLARQAPPGPGFQLGSAGIALGLLAAISPVTPAWDEVLLLSQPGSGRRATSRGSG